MWSSLPSVRNLTLTLLSNKVDTVRGRTVAVDKDTLATNLPGIFAGGDVVTGTTFVVDAISAGHKAARSIEAYLKEEDKEARIMATGVRARRKVAGSQTRASPGKAVDGGQVASSHDPCRKA